MSGPAESVNDASRGEALPVTAGRELDALVATRVMGWPVVSDSDAITGFEGYVCGGSAEWGMGRGSHYYYRPSSEIADAWEVVEAMQGRGWRFTVADSSTPGSTYARFENGASLFASVAETAPLAICRAAIAAETRPV